MDSNDSEDQALPCPIAEEAELFKAYNQKLKASLSAKPPRRSKIIHYMHRCIDWVVLMK